jgi:NDP-sugar pyrophosphorylase family protein
MSERDAEQDAILAARKAHRESGLLLPRGIEAREDHLELPERGTCRIDPLATIHPRAKVEHATIRGNSYIEATAQVSHATIDSSRVAGRVSYATVYKSHITEGADVQGGSLDKALILDNSLILPGASICSAVIKSSKVSGALSESDLEDSTVHKTGIVHSGVSLKKSTVEGTVVGSGNPESPIKLSQVVVHPGATHTDGNLDSTEVR